MQWGRGDCSWGEEAAPAGCVGSPVHLCTPPLVLPNSSTVLWAQLVFPTAGITSQHRILMAPAVPCQLCVTVGEAGCLGISSIIMQAVPKENEAHKFYPHTPTQCHTAEAKVLV